MLDLLGEVRTPLESRRGWVANPNYIRNDSRGGNEFGPYSDGRSSTWLTLRIYLALLAWACAVTVSSSSAHAIRPMLLFMGSH